MARSAASTIRGVLLLLALVGPFLALDARAQRLQARLYNEDDGLASLSIMAVAQDPQGYLWVGTENGLFRFSGSYFEEFGRKNGFHEPAVYSLLVDHTGTLWAGTHTGLFWYGGGSFHEVEIDGRSLRIGINCMLTSTAAGELIVQDDDRTFSVLRTHRPATIDDTWEAMPYEQRHPGFPRLKEANGVGVDSREHLIIGCEEAICSFAEGHLRSFGPAEGVPKDFYMSFFRASSGQLWARGRKHVLTRNANEASFRDVTSLLPGDAVHTIYRTFTEDRSGHILTPTAQGFASWDGKGWSETQVTSHGPIHGATQVFGDSEGALWIGTEGSGLLQSLGYGRSETFGTESGLASQNVTALMRDERGAIWLGNNLALNRLALGALTMTSIPLRDRDHALMISALSSDARGGTWVGTLLGDLTHIDPRGRMDVQATVNAYVYQLLPVDGTLWMATNKGLFSARCRPGEPCVPQPFGADTIGANTVGSIAPDGNGGLWVAGRHGLDHILHGGVLHVRVAAQKQDFSLATPAGPDELWMAGEGPGLFRVRVKDGEAQVLEAHTRPELLSDRIQFLALDGKGRLWAGTDHGVDVLEHGKVRGITTGDGLSANNAITFLADGDGSVWIGTTSGVSHLLYPEQVLSRPGFSARIDTVYHNGVDQRAFASGSSTRPFKISWSKGSTVIRFSATTFRDTHALLYHYKLVGLESFSTTTTVDFARWQRLPPGSYTLQVVAEDPIHHVFSTPASFLFTIVPPWYKSRWMFLPLLVLCFGLIQLVWRSSHSLLIRRQKKLERLVVERTREIEQMALRDSLTGVMNRKAIMARLEEEVEYARRHGTPLCVALIDLDHFKRINDTLGHLAGDEVLRESARRLSSAIRTSDAIGRYGGEEFILLFRNVEREFGFDHCQRVRQQLCEEPIRFEDHSLPITCSIGLAWSSEVSDLTPALLARADEAMYRAKQNGRNRVECAFSWDDSHERVLALR